MPEYELVPQSLGSAAQDQGLASEYNQYRPHSSLAYRTPYQFAQKFLESQKLILQT